MPLFGLGSPAVIRDSTRGAFCSPKEVTFSSCPPCKFERLRCGRSAGRHVKLRIIHDTRATQMYSAKNTAPGASFTCRAGATILDMIIVMRIAHGTVLKSDPGAGRAVA
jgi:hypothetical protein